MAGAAKLVDPSGSTGALRALGFPARDDVVRTLAAFEMLLGAAALLTTALVVVLLLGLSYAVFAVITVRALARGVPIDSCGCLGRLETPPSWRHLVVVGLVVLGALGVALDRSPSLLERVSDDGAAGVLFAVVTVVLTAVVVVVLRAGRRPIAAPGGSDAAR